jgi:transposase InsO family protein
MGNSFGPNGLSIGSSLHVSSSKYPKSYCMKVTSQMWSSTSKCSRDAGIRVVLIPECAPNANAYAERFVRSIKKECLDRIVPIGERHFRHVITQFADHYHRERNHQGLDNRLIAGTPVTDRTGRVRCRRRLGMWPPQLTRAFEHYTENSF